MKAEAGEARGKIVPDEVIEPFCTKPFAAESARDNDVDEPCQDGGG
ncbi:MAG TPA: hypothetical protein VMV44_15765 [Rectinemataceae bacterium]|nr:hypothetical protein [Rectinemataceae bacterium]